MSNQVAVDLLDLDGKETGERGLEPNNHPE